MKRTLIFLFFLFNTYSNHIILQATSVARYDYLGSPADPSSVILQHMIHRGQLDKVAQDRKKVRFDDLTDRVSGSSQMAIIRVGSTQPDGTIKWTHIFKETRNSEELTNLIAAKNFVLAQAPFQHGDYKLNFNLHEKLWRVTFPHKSTERYFELLQIAQGNTLSNSLKNILHDGENSFATRYDFFDLKNGIVIKDNDLNDLLSEQRSAIIKERRKYPKGSEGWIRENNTLREFEMKYKLHEGGTALAFFGDGSLGFREHSINAVVEAFKQFGYFMGNFAKRHQKTAHPVNGGKVEFPALDIHPGNFSFDETSKTLHWFDLDRLGKFSLQPQKERNDDLIKYPFHSSFFHIFYTNSMLLMPERYLENGVESIFPDYQNHPSIKQTLIAECEMMLTLVERITRSYVEAFVSNWQDEGDKKALRQLMYPKTSKNTLFRDIADHRAQLRSSLELQIQTRNARHESLCAKMARLKTKITGLISERDQAQKRLTQINTQLTQKSLNSSQKSDLEAKRKSFQIKRDKANKELSALIAEKESLEKELQHISAKITTLKKKEKEEEAALKVELERKHKSLTAKVPALIKQITGLTSERDQAQKRLAQINSQLTQKSLNSSQKSDLEAKRKSFQIKRDKANKELSALIAEKESLEKELQYISAKITTLKKKEESIISKKKIAELDAKKHSLTIQYKKTTGDDDASKQKRNHLTKRLQQISAEITQLQNLQKVK